MLLMLYDAQERLPAKPFSYLTRLQFDELIARLPLRGTAATARTR